MGPNRVNDTFETGITRPQTTTRILHRWWATQYHMPYSTTAFRRVH